LTQSIAKSIGIDYCNTFSQSYWYWYWQYFFGLVLVLNIAILFTSIVNNPAVVELHYSAAGALFVHVQ